MTLVSIDIPEAQLARVVAGICHAENKPVSNANAKAGLVSMVRLRVKEQERLEAVATAEATVTPVEGIT